MRRRPRRELFECPNCGADVPVGAAACKECGSDAQTGWQSGEEIDYQSVEVPDGWSEDGPVSTSARRPKWWVIAIVVLTALGMLLWAVRR